MIDVYESAVENTGALGVVFEQDDETAYLYLLDLRRDQEMRIVAAYNVGAAADWTGDASTSVEWNSPGTAAGLFIDGSLIALYDVRGGEPVGRLAAQADDELFRRQ